MVRLVLEHANGKWLWGPQWKFTLLEQGVGVTAQGLGFLPGVMGTLLD